jgi:hypothetical protein
MFVGRQRRCFIVGVGDGGIAGKRVGENKEENSNILSPRGTVSWHTG